jgi:hypothetical protein
MICPPPYTISPKQLSHFIPPDYRIRAPEALIPANMAYFALIRQKEKYLYINVIKIFLVVV